MDRRHFIAGTGALLVSPGLSSAQGPRRRLGFLAGGDGSGQAPNQNDLALLNALRERGWIDGKNLTIDLRYSQPPDRLSASVADLMALNPDVLVAVAPRAAIALKSATTTIPIVFVSVADPVGLGLVQSLSRPNGNVTGFATMVPEDFLGKRIEILRELIPGASTIALLVNPENQMHRLALADPRTHNLGLKLVVVEASRVEELEIAFASAVAQHAEAIVDLGDPLTAIQSPRVIALAAKHHLPANYLLASTALNGGLSSYGPEFADLFRRAGEYVDKILRGTRPSELPVERPAKFVLVINMKTAKALGLTVPASLLVRADQVVE
jgi:putative tryptophan/tyrosine transport system substrate-binding protein